MLENSGADFGPDTPEERIAEWVEEARTLPDGSDRLVSLLPESLPLYSGRSANEFLRLRGYIMASFERTGLPVSALPYVREELESGHDAYLVAAAAKAIRGLNPCAGELAPFLLRAIENMRYADDTVTFDCYKPQFPLTHPTTALIEIMKTFGAMGPAAQRNLEQLESLYRCEDGSLSRPVRDELRRAIDSIRASELPSDPACCSGLRSLEPLFRNLPSRQSGFDEITGITLEDQGGNTIQFGEYFKGKPSVVVFFYTRCDNPQKCSLTVSKLARLQKEMEAQGLNGKLKLAAFTYDPHFDLPFRLTTYGEERGFAFSEHERFFRTPDGLKALQAYFSLGVNYVNTIVNRHRIELSILNDQGRVVRVFSHVQWDIHEVLGEARKLLAENNALIHNSNNTKEASRSPSRNLGQRAGSVAGRSVLSALSPIAIAFFPKCPFCWAAYMAAFGTGTLQRIPYSPWLLPVFVLLLLFQLTLQFRRSRHTNRYEPFVLALAGAVILLVGGLVMHIETASLVGVWTLVAGSVLNSLPVRPPVNARLPIQRLPPQKVR